MSFQPDDRVLVKPLGVKGTVIRIRADDGRVVVLADCSVRAVPWLESELEKL